MFYHLTSFSLTQLKSVFHLVARRLNYAWFIQHINSNFSEKTLTDIRLIISLYEGMHALPGCGPWLLLEGGRDKARGTPTVCVRDFILVL